MRAVWLVNPTEYWDMQEVLSRHILPTYASYWAFQTWGSSKKMIGFQREIPSRNGWELGVALLQEPPPSAFGQPSCTCRPPWNHVPGTSQACWCRSLAGNFKGRHLEEKRRHLATSTLMAMAITRMVMLGFAQLQPGYMKMFKLKNHGDPTLVGGVGHADPIVFKRQGLQSIYLQMQAKALPAGRNEAFGWATQCGFSLQIDWGILMFNCCWNSVRRPPVRILHHAHHTPHQAIRISYSWAS